MRFKADVHTMALVDLVGYSDVAALLEETAGVETVAVLNADIQELIDAGLRVANADRLKHVVMTTGDGALLQFDGADKALTFSAGLHSACEQANSTRSSPHAKRRFRIGIGTGDIAYDTSVVAGNGLAGMAIARAARLEAKASPGGTLIDAETWSTASIPLRALFKGPETISGKREEEYLAYRWQASKTDFVYSAIKPTKPDISIRRKLVHEISVLMTRINKSIQVTLLERKLQLPFDQVPSDNIPVERRMVEILEWCDREDCLYDLLIELGGLLGHKTA